MLNLQAGANPVAEGIKSYAALQGVRLADEEMALKKQTAASEMENRTKLTGLAEKDQALRQTTADQQTTAFNQAQELRTKQQTLNKMRSIAAKLNAPNGLAQLTPDEHTIVRSDPAFADFVHNPDLVAKLKENIGQLEDKFKKGDTAGMAYHLNSLFPEGINVGADKFNGEDIRATAAKWQAPGRPPGFVRATRDGNGNLYVVPPDSPPTQGEEPIQLGKRMVNLQISEDATRYLPRYSVTTIDPSTKEIVTYDADSTEGRGTGAPPAWKPVENLIAAVQGKSGMAKYVETYALGIGDPATVALHNKKNELDVTAEHEKGKRAEIEGERRTKLKPVIDEINRQMSNMPEGSEKEEMGLMMKAAESGDDTLYKNYSASKKYKAELAQRDKEFGLKQQELSMRKSELDTARTNSRDNKIISSAAAITASYENKAASVRQKATELRTRLATGMVIDQSAKKKAEQQIDDMETLAVELQTKGAEEALKIYQKAGMAPESPAAPAPAPSATGAPSLVNPKTVAGAMENFKLSPSSPAITATGAPAVAAQEAKKEFAPNPWQVKNPEAQAFIKKNPK